MKIDYFTLISGTPQNIGEYAIYPPKLKDIRRIGYKRYQEFIGVFLMNGTEIVKMLNLAEEAEVSQLTTLQIVTLLPEFRNLLLDSLSFFLHEIVSYDENIGYSIGPDRLGFEEIRSMRSIILQFCRVEDQEETEVKTFFDEKTRQRYEKIQRLKSKFSKAKKKQENIDFDLPNLISAVAAVSPTYNLMNIWELTIYQFYDQFERINGKIQLDVFGQKWAAWGQEDFDFSLWHRAATKNN